MSHRSHVQRPMLQTLTVVGAVFTMLTAVGCTADIEVDHASGPQAKPLAGKAPREGRFERAWRTKVPGKSGMAYYVNGTLVVRSGNGLRGYDPRTGESNWHYREPDRALNGIAITDGVVVLNTNGEDEEGSSTDWQTVGLDAATGEILWQKQRHWYLAYDESDIVGTGKLGVAERGTVVVRPDDSERLGIDARTGDKRWSVSESDLSEGECDRIEGEPAPESDRTHLIGIRLGCESQDLSATEVLAAVDTDSGDVRWTRPVPHSESETRMRRGYTLLRKTSESPPIVLDPEGKRLHAADDDASCTVDECQLLVTGDRVVLSYTKEDGETNDDRRSVVLDPETGDKQVVTNTEGGAFAGELAAADGRLYGIGPLATRDSRFLFPQALRTYDVRSDANRQTQLPLPESSGIHTDTPIPPMRVLGAAGNRVLVQSGGGTNQPLELTAYRRVGNLPEPTELGGVNPADWPAPCDLLDGLPVRSLSGYDEDRESEPPEPQGKALRVGGSTVPHTSCRWDVPGATPITVTVMWVASSPDEADAMFPGRASKLKAVDEELPEADGYAQRGLFRIGHTIVKVETEDMDTVTHTMRTNLRGSD